MLKGFFFGSVGATIALSPIGKISGAHINPVVTMGFWSMGKLTGRTAIGYVVAQLCVAVTTLCLVSTFLVHTLRKVPRTLDESTHLLCWREKCIMDLAQQQQ